MIAAVANPQGGEKRKRWPDASYATRGSRCGRNRPAIAPRSEASESNVKPIYQVMADVADPVEIRHTLRQIVNVKDD